MRKTVCVVGAGAAGLVCVKSCLEEDLQVICYEQNDSIGKKFIFYDSLLHKV